jgi:hypothetical protein
MGKRWAWVAWSMLAVYLVSMVAAIILSVVNDTFQPDAAGRSGWHWASVPSWSSGL